MASINYCPICILGNKYNKLVLYQINLRLAVYLCEDKNCTYPEGYEVVQVEPRSLKELSNANKKQQAQKTDLDSWLDDFFAKEDMIHNTQTEHDNLNDDDLKNIINEISECGNENDLDLQNESDLLSLVDSAFNQCSLSNEKGNQENEEKIDNVTNTAISTTSPEKYINDNEQSNEKTPKYHILNFELFKNTSYATQL